MCLCLCQSHPQCESITNLPHVCLVFDNYSATIKVGEQSLQISLWDTMARSEEGEHLIPLAYPQTDVRTTRSSATKHAHKLHTQEN